MRRSLERDHVTDMKHPKAPRGSRLRKKLRAGRAHRPAIRQELHAVPHHEADDGAPSQTRMPVRTWRGTVIPLGEMAERARTLRRGPGGGQA
jgi:hypothetical protein